MTAAGMWSAAFEDVVRAHLKLPPEGPLPADVELVTYGLDSMATVSLMVELEQQFSITFPDEALVPETFATAAALWAVASALPVRAG